MLSRYSAQHKVLPKIVVFKRAQLLDYNRSQGLLGSMKRIIGTLYRPDPEILTHGLIMPRHNCNKQAAGLPEHPVSRCMPTAILLLGIQLTASSTGQCMEE